MDARLMTLEELHSLKDGQTLFVEMQVSTKDGGSTTGGAWGVMNNRMGETDSGMLVSLLGTFMPDMIRNIPYRTTTDEHVVLLYRFWTGRTTKEQSEAIPWDTGSV